MRRARNFSPKYMSSDPVAREVFLMACLADFLLLKDHPPRFDVLFPASLCQPGFMLNHVVTSGNATYIAPVTSEAENVRRVRQPDRSTIATP
jgi:hypothetical protein